jgi:hypothetical protein
MANAPSEEIEVVLKVRGTQNRVRHLPRFDWEISLHSARQLVLLDNSLILKFKLNEYTSHAAHEVLYLLTNLLGTRYMICKIGQNYRDYKNVILQFHPII